MAASKKRRKPPEEDLAAAVADIINSPITRSNLSFLRPLPVPASPEADAPSPKPMGLELKPMGGGLNPEPQTVREVIAPPSSLASSQSVFGPDIAAIPRGLEQTPMGFELTPTGFWAPEALSRPDRSPPPGHSTPERRQESLPWKPPSPALTLWQAEGLGTLIEQSRVRRIHQAQDALSLVEEKVYDLLWGTKNQRKDEFRLVHYSLQRIAAEARINIKTVRELIPRLIEKGFIYIEHEADARRNIPTLYRVSGYAAVLSDQKRRNRLYVAKTGKGVVYVHSVSAAMTTVGPIRPRDQNPWVLSLRPWV